MFWSKDKKSKKKQNAQNKKQGKRHSKKSKQVSVGTTNEGQRTREELEAQALASMRLARESIGDENLARIAAAIQNKQDSPAERARELIRGAEPDSVLYEMRHLIDN